MSKARTLANLISDNAELADGQISVAEVVGAAPTASPTFTGTTTQSGVLLMNTNHIQFTGNLSKPNVGAAIYRPAADSVAVLTNNQDRMVISNTEVNFNEDSQNTDFRIESDNNSNMFFVNGGTDRIGIGTSNPSTFIHAQSSGDIQFRFETTSDSTAQIQYKNASNQWSAGIDNLEQFFIYDSTNAHSALTFRPLNEVVFNQNSKNVDFRIESDSNANMLFC
jgi:hypothetical protein